MSSAKSVAAAAHIMAQAAAAPPTPPPQTLSASALANASAADKDELRALRMHRSNGLKERLWDEWQKLCFAECDAQGVVKEYWLCRQEQGLLAPLRCGAESAAMKGCLQRCGKDEARFTAHRERRIAEIAEASAAVAAGKAPPPKPQAPR